MSYMNDSINAGSNTNLTGISVGPSYDLMGNPVDTSQQTRQAMEQDISKVLSQLRNDGKDKAIANAINERLRLGPSDATIAAIDSNVNALLTQEIEKGDAGQGNTPSAAVHALHGAKFYLASLVAGAEEAVTPTAPDAVPTTQQAMDLRAQRNAEFSAHSLSLQNT